MLILSLVFPHAVPKLVPRDLTGDILSYVTTEPPSFFFQWEIRNIDRHLLHDITAFVITCSAHKTTTTTNTINDSITISKPVFLEADDGSFQTDFSTLLYFPNTCGSHVSEEISCTVAAFNEQGRGEESNRVNLTLPCNYGKCVDTTYLHDLVNKTATPLAAKSPILSQGRMMKVTPCTCHLYLCRP